MADDCTTCHFNRDGFCQRFPPQVTLYPTDNQHPIHYAVGDGFPSAMAGRWCGEWRASIFEIHRADQGAGQPSATTMPRVLRHGEYQLGDRVRYTARGIGSALGWVGRVGTFEETCGRNSYARIAFTGHRTTCHIDSLEHESLPQFEAGDVVRVNSGSPHAEREAEVIGINPIPRTAMSCVLGYGIVTFPFGALALVCPAQHREAARG